MKKFLALFLTAVLCLSCFSLTAFAEEEKTEMVPVVVKVPENWENPCLWAWADDGTNAFAAWPGEEMEAMEDGWYYTYVPAFVQNVIVNACNDAEEPVQTEGLVVEAGKSVWITVAEDKTAAISYEVQSGEVPEYVEKFVIHAYVPMEWKTVNMWAWSAPDGTNAFAAWPGAAMKEGEDGWFTAKAPVWVNSLIINGNEGSVQTEDVAIEGKELWITVYEDLTYDLSYEDPNKAVEDITVHAKVPADWTAPSCWAWSAPDGTNAFATWPGEKLTQNGDWYEIVVPGWINSVIINANEGAVQTTDLSVETGKDLWIVVADPETATVTYEEPVDASAATVATDSATIESEFASVETAPAEKPASDSNTGMVVGIVLAVVVAAAIVVIVVKKKKK